MSTVIDRRLESSQGRDSRERFLRRTRRAIKEAIDKSLEGKNVTDIARGGVDVTVPKGGLSEPSFRHGEGGINHKVLPGNNNHKARFKVGDRLPRSQKGGGRGNAASEDGEGQDDFLFHISEEEVLNHLFEELELPNMFKFGAEDLEKTTLEQAGFGRSGPINRLDFVRSKIEKTKREVVMNKKTNEKIIELLQELKQLLTPYSVIDTFLNTQPSDATPVKLKIKILKAEVEALEESSEAVPARNKTRINEIHSELDVLYGKRRRVGRWREGQDLRYRAVEEEPKPASKAVMFCEMDVSGSMNQEMKNNAKLFFFLLHRFLTRHYDQVDVVFIRHHSIAKEVDEKEFFEGTETGGTVVSTAHELLLDIQEARYPQKEWNLYAAQASDGDNAPNDNEKTAQLMRKILPLMQGFFHIEVGNGGSHRNTDLWKTYLPLASEFSDRFWMEKVRERKEVTPVFHGLFRKRSGNGLTAQSRSTVFQLRS